MNISLKHLLYRFNNFSDFQREADNFKLKTFLYVHIVYIAYVSFIFVITYFFKSFTISLLCFKCDWFCKEVQL